MLSAARRHFTFAGLIATLALVLAMSGGAWAAKKYLITSTKQISPSVLKKLKGSAGPQGPQGAQGGPGPKGDAGAAGQGTNGLSVTSTKLNPGDLNCKEGGSRFVIGTGTPTFACNGSPWTAEGKLPSEATETGMWSVGTTVGGPSNQYLALSFPLPLEEPIEAANVHYIKSPGEDPTNCPGSVEEPEAAPEQFCLYKQVSANMEDLTPATLSQGGAIMVAEATAEALAEEFPIFGFGSWAVTAG